MTLSGRLLVLCCGLPMVTTLSAAEFAASLTWYQNVPLGFPISGVVRSVAVDTGERVKQGDVLMQLDDTVRRAQLHAAEARLKAAQNHRDEAQREMDRTQEMYDQTLLADHDLQMAIIARDAVEADFQSAQAEFIQARQALQYTTLQAPFNGLVARRQAAVGQFVNADLAAEALLYVADDSRMLARILVDAAQWQGRPVGHAARVVAGRHDLNGRISRVARGAPHGSPDKLAVEVLFDTGGHPFYVGQRVKVIIE